MVTEELNTPHGIIRKSARDKYLKRAQKQQEIYDNKCAKVEKIYKENDIISVSIHSADRTHTDKKIMPCRILEIKDDKSVNFCRVFTENGILKTLFTAEALVDLRGNHFTALNNTDPTQLQEITLVHATRIFSKWTTKPPTLCACRGNCINNRCNCKRNGIGCSTKCHHVSANGQNKI